MTANWAKKTVGKFVPSTGPLDAKIVVIGESPWTQEANLGQPFVGQSGKKQDMWWFEVGLNRADIRIMNLYPYQPPRREIESIPTDVLIKWIDELHNRIAKLEGPKVLVPLGNYATFALTGKGKIRAAIRNAFSTDDTSVTSAEKKAGITQLRGSIYKYVDRCGREMRVVPIIHPAAVLQMEKWEKRTVRDWEKVLKIAYSPEHVERQRNHIVDPSEWQVEEFTRQVENHGGDIAMAVDIETWGKQLSCVGFALTPDESITLSTAGRERDVFLPYVKRLCESGAQKILCNGFYDWYWLAWYGVWLKNFIWDVQLMHHAVDPAENHSLDFLASIYCPDYRFWKDEAKDAEEIIRYAHDLESLWIYNGLDCCYTRELLDLIYGDLQRLNMVDFYFRHYVNMLEPLTRTMLHGMRVDKDAQKTWAKKLRGELKAIHKELNEAAGEELFATEEKTKLREPTEEEWIALLGVVQGKIKGKHLDTPAPKSKDIDREARQKLIDEHNLTYMIGGANAGKIRYKVVKLKKDFSRDKLMRFFYEKLGLPQQMKLTKGKNGKKRTLSLDEGAIRKLTAKWPKKIGNYGNLLLAHREKKKELYYLKGAYDKDSRVRCSYKMLTEAGRLASSKNPRGTGYNLQNIKR